MVTAAAVRIQLQTPTIDVTYVCMTWENDSYMMSYPHTSWHDTRRYKCKKTRRASVATASWHDSSSYKLQVSCRLTGQRSLSIKLVVVSCSCVIVKCKTYNMIMPSCQVRTVFPLILPVDIQPAATSTPSSVCAGSPTKSVPRVHPESIFLWYEYIETRMPSRQKITLKIENWSRWSKGSAKIINGIKKQTNKCNRIRYENTTSRTRNYK